MWRGCARVREKLGAGAVAAAARCRGAGFPVQGHDEMVAGAGAGDVQQPQPFVLVHLLVERLGVIVVAGLDVAAEPERAAAVAGPQHLDRAPGPAGLAGHPGQDDDRELKSLGRVDGHDPQRVGVGFRQYRLGGAGCFLALARRPRSGRRAALRWWLRTRRGPGR